VVTSRRNYKNTKKGVKMYITKIEFGKLKVSVESVTAEQGMQVMTQWAATMKIPSTKIKQAKFCPVTKALHTKIQRESFKQRG
jgi:hypothetical protein